MLLILLEISRMSCGTWVGADKVCWLGRNFGSPLAAEAWFRQRITSRGQLPVSIMHLSGGVFFSFANGRGVFFFLSFSPLVSPAPPSQGCVYWRR